MRKHLLIAFLMLWCAGSIVGQELDSATHEMMPQRGLSLSEILQIVRDNNREIKAAELTERMRKSDIAIARGYRLGSLDFSETYMRTDHPMYVFGMKLGTREASFNDFGFDEFLAWMQTDMQGDVLGIQPDNLNHAEDRQNFETKLTYSVPLYTGDKLPEYQKIATEMAEISGLDKQQMVNEKVVQAKKTFYDIALLDSFEINLQTIDTTMVRLERTVQSMIDEGYAKKIDLLEVQTQRANVERLLNQTRANRQLAYEFLSFLAGEEIGRITAEFQSAAIPEVDESWLLAHNIDLQKAHKGQLITARMVEVAEADYLPTLGAFGEVGYNSEDLDDPDDKNYYMVGAQLSWNLFSGGSHTAAHEKARLEKLRMDTRAELAKEGILLQYSKILTEIKSLAFDIDSMEKERQLNDEIYQNYHARYKESLVSINDVLIKQSLFIQTTIKLQELQNRRNKKIFELEKLANKGSS